LITKSSIGPEICNVMLRHTILFVVGLLFCGGFFSSILIFPAFLQNDDICSHDTLYLNIWHICV